MRVKIWGCRGSLPAPLKPPDVEEKIVQAIHGMPAIDTQDLAAVRAYVRSLSPLQRGTAGGNTTCVEVQAGGKTLVVDAGTGIRELGLELMKGPFGRGEGELHLMFSHLHWDHVQGFPFFMPAFIPGNRITIYGLHDLQSGLQDQQRFLNFPVPMSAMAASIEFMTLTEGEPFYVGDVRINTIRNSHPGNSYGYRFEDGHSVFVFASDAEYKDLRDTSVQPHLEFFRDADALVFDAQYTLGEGWVKEDWGHSSAMIGVDLALAAGVKRLLLFHHDPVHTDARLQQILVDAGAYRDEKASHAQCEILVAYEGLTLDLTPSGAVGTHATPKDSAVVLAATRVFDDLSVSRIAEQLAIQDGQAAPGYVIDLSQVETLSTASLKLLVNLQQERQPVPVVLAAPSNSAMRVIELGGFSDYFAIYPTVELASAALLARVSLALPGQTLGGRYQIERLLGTGKMGAVLCAFDQQAATQVALKIVDPAYGQQALQRLLDQRPVLVKAGHPNLLRVYDLATENHITYLVEAFHPGVTLDILLKDAGEGLTTSRAFEIALEVAKALENAHGQGLVHADLSPENVFLDGSDVLVGGLALGHMEEGRNLLEAPLVRQTAAYLAPEQIVGQAIDARTDLYAFGVMLYELFTGRVPFQGSEPEIMQAHLAQEPRPPHDLNADISPSLDHLIRKLLAKSPGNRYGSVTQVRRILGMLSTGDTEPLLGRDKKLFGRKHQLQQLEDAWRVASGGQGRLVFISGEEGVGKTSLAEQGASLSKAAVVLAAHCGDQQGARPFRVFAQAVAAYLALAPRDLSDQGARELLANFARVLPADTSVAPDLDIPPPLEPKQEQLRVMSSMTRFIGRATRERPWVLILDDLQWADESSLELLRYLSFDLPRMPLLILAIYRDTELGQDHPLSTVLRQLESHSSASYINLDRLDLTGVAEMLADLWGASPPAALVEAIYRHTEGNPFFVEEIARSLVDEQAVISRLGAPQFPEPASVRLPESVHQVVRRRVSTLHGDTQTLLQQASVMGYDFAIGILQEVSELPEWSVLEHLDVALQHQLVQEDGADGKIRFRHAEIRQALYESIPSLRRRLWHRKAGEVLEGLAGSRGDTDAEILAHHYSQAQVTDKAIRYSYQAAQKAQATYANASAAQWYAQVLNLLDALGPAQAKEFLTIHFDSLLNLGKVLELTGAWDAAGEHYEAALAQARDMDDEEAQAWSETAMGELMRKRNRYDAADEWLARARRHFESRQDLAGVGQVLQDMGTLAAHGGDYDGASRYYNESLALRRQLGDRAHEANLLANLGIVARALEDPSLARRNYEESLAISEAINNRWGVAVALNNLGILAIDRTEYATARDLFGRALLIWREIGERWATTNTLHNLANVAREEGDAEQARRLYTESLAGWQELDDRWGLAYWLEDTGLFQLRLGAPERTIQLEGAAQSLRDQIGAPRPPAYQTRLDEAMAPAQDALGKEATAASRKAGRSLSLQEAIALALAVDGA